MGIFKQEKRGDSLFPRWLVVVCAFLVISLYVIVGYVHCHIAEKEFSFYCETCGTHIQVKTRETLTEAQKEYFSGICLCHMVEQ